MSKDIGLVIYTLGGASTPLIVVNFKGPPANWLTDDEILYSGVQGGPIKLKSLLDDSSMTLVPAEDGIFHAYPIGLPGTRAALYSAQTGMDNSESDIRVFNPEDASSTPLIVRAYSPRYAPTGHITFIREGDLWAVPFDLDSLQLVGPEVMVLEGVQSATRVRQGSYAFSDLGRLVYLSGTEANSSASELIVVSRNGEERSLDRMSGSFAQPMLSADGQLLAVTGYSGPTSSDVWLYDLARDNFSRRTFMEGAFKPAFSVDGSQIFFRSRLNPGIWVANSDGTGEPEQIFSGEVSGHSSQSPADGSLLYIIGERDSRTLHTLNYTDSVWVNRQVANLTNEGYMGVLSPDGKWMAYVSNDSGREEVYVRAYPDLTAGKYQISTAGGREPLWSSNGEEVIFINYSGSLMTARVEADRGFSSDLPVILMAGVQVDAFNFPSYAASIDGQTLVIKKRNVDAPIIDGNSSSTTLTVIENWFEELKRLTPADLR